MCAPTTCRQSAAASVCVRRRAYACLQCRQGCSEGMADPARLADSTGQRPRRLGPIAQHAGPPYRRVLKAGVLGHIVAAQRQFESRRGQTWVETLGGRGGRLDCMPSGSLAVVPPCLRRDILDPDVSEPSSTTTTRLRDRSHAQQKHTRIVDKHRAVIVTSFASGHGRAFSAPH